ncbi:MAG: SHOCT domain-containing protein [Prochlorotrichaceae cyanobacterium]|jgi:hypothetical protein
MAKNYFIVNYADEINLIYREIINWFKNKQYEIESKTIDKQYFIQAKKTNAIRTLLGANLAFQVNLYLAQDSNIERELIIETSIGKWVTNIAGAGFTSLFMGGIPIFTGIANAGWAFLLEAELILYLENTLKIKKVTIVDSNPSVSSGSKQKQGIHQPTVIDVTATTLNRFTPRDKAEAKIQEDLKKLDQALQYGIIDRLEFNKKKANLEEKADRYEAEFIIEEKMEKLQKAFAEGVLDTIEYELKIKELHELVDDQIIRRRQNDRKAAKLSKLKEALENGILTEAEFHQKLENL